MKKTILMALALVLGAVWGAEAQTIEYKGETVTLGPHAFLVDGSITTTPGSPYVFTSFNEAAARFTPGTPDNPMRVYIAPWVYWIDDPDDPADRRPVDGRGPFGLVVKCENLHLLGTTGTAGDVVLACNRGQTQGSIGNYTMFDFWGDGLVVKDLTMGNYCNIDLDYPRLPQLSRPRRNSAITQAHVAYCHGDRIYAENVNFLSRLNMNPLGGAKRILFVGCHMESTDDALTSTGVYLGCTLDFWGQQPFGHSDVFGAVFLDCDFSVRHGCDEQCLSKGVGRFSVIDSRYHTDHDTYLSWTKRPTGWLRCYQYGVTVNGLPAFIGAARPANTVCLDDSPQLAAYRLVKDDGSVVYNTYNLLCGSDGWDPQGLKPLVEALSGRDGRDCGAIGTCLHIDRREAFLQTGDNGVTLNAGVYRHCGYLLDNQLIHWKVQPGFERFVCLSATEGKTCRVEATNVWDDTQRFCLIAYTDDGLACGVELTVAPDFVDAPAFVKKPSVTVKNGVARVDYTLALEGRADESVITWYRDGIPVSYGRPAYPLTAADRGHVMSVGVAPKHLRCQAGQEERTVFKGRGFSDDRTLRSDFSDFPYVNQTEILPGYWTVDAFKPDDTRDYDWRVDHSKPCWTYGPGINGAVGLGLQQVQQGARLRYTPVSGRYSDMSVTWQVDPAKTAGQGFASARQQYLDLFVKFDTERLTGYALRVIRTTKFADAVDVLLVKYDEGRVTPLTEGVSTDGFLTGCVLRVAFADGVLSAHVEGPAQRSEPVTDPRIQHVVDLSCPAEDNGFGGLGLQHTSTVGAESRILLHSVEATWR